MVGAYLQMTNIRKAFFDNTVLNDVSIDVELGKVYSLVGENGAGKSTLMKILCGALVPDYGEIAIAGKKVEMKTPLQGIKNGIAMIYQELTPVPEMTVAENVFLGREDTKAGIINYKRMNQKAQQLLDSLGMELSATAQLKELKVSDMQLVEICKAISYDSNIIIMDEPTSSLSKKEIERLYRVTENLIKKKKSVIFISHKMDEIFAMSDEIFVLRDGEMIAKNINVKDTCPEELISMMVGRQLKDIYPQRNQKIGEVVLKVEGLSSDNGTHDVSFELKRGEILGVSGLVGAGRTEMAESLFGLANNVSGNIYLEGKRVQIKSPVDAIKKGMAFVTEDRKMQGLFLQASIKENVSVSSLGKLLKRKLISKKLEKQAVEKQMAELNIKATGLEQLVKNLSGGNQQKVVLAKWLMTDPKILILDEPTRGIDVGAKFEIYKIINQLTEAGCSVILISSELPEIIGLSDRVLCFHEFRLVGEVNKSDISQETIMTMATGTAV